MRAKSGKQAVRELARFRATSRDWIGARMPVLPRASVRVIAFLVAGGAFGLAVAGAEPTYIVALGASFIHGKGVLPSEAFPAQLENMLRAKGFNVQVINAGIDGDTTTNMLFRMDAAVPQGTKIAIVQPGSNDFKSRKHGLSVDQHLANIATIIGRLRAQQIRVVLCGGEPAEAELARRYDAIAVSCGDPSHLLDGEHLDPTGHRIAAARLLPIIEGMLTQR
jgi:acyl-CoA thioesterase I